MHRPSLNNSLHPTWRPLPLGRQAELAKEVGMTIVPTLWQELVQRQKVLVKKLERSNPSPEVSEQLQNEIKTIQAHISVLSEITMKKTSLYFDIDGEFTTCTIQLDDDSFVTGVSRKSKKDKPNNALGLKLALQRALTKTVKSSESAQTHRSAIAYKVTHIKAAVI